MLNYLFTSQLLQAAPAREGGGMMAFITLLLLGALIIFLLSKVFKGSSFVSKELFNYPRQLVFDEVTEILMSGNNRMKLTNIDEANSIIQAKAKVSLSSWGETIVIQVVPLTETSCEVKIGSKSNYGFSMGKNRENINDILMQLKMCLRRRNSQ